MSSEPEVIAFFERVCALAPEIVALRAEHLEDYDGEMLGHVLISDVRQWAINTLDRNEAAVDRVLAEMNRSFEDREDPVSNMIAVSFLEHLAGEPPHSKEARLRKRLPERLAKVVVGFENWRPY